MKTKEEILQEFDPTYYDQDDLSQPEYSKDSVLLAMEEYATQFQQEWIPVEVRPLFTKDDKGIWTCTEDGDNEFFAAVPYAHSAQPDKTIWWIRHCVVEDEIGLCVVGDSDNESAGWTLEDVTHWMPLPPKPQPYNPTKS